MSQVNDSTIWHLMQLNGASLLNAEYTSHHFAPHYHEELAIGVIQRGKLNVHIGKNERMTLSTGHIVVINPGEIHEGFTDGNDGCFYRMFYLPATLLGKATGFGDEYVPQFNRCAIHDSLSAQQLTWLHRNLATPSISALEYESHLLEVINRLISRYGDSGAPSTPQYVSNTSAIRQAQAYLAEHCTQKISLDALSAHVGLSPYHFLRTFKETIGMTPHAFLMQMRIDQAKSQLMRGEAIVNVAADLGFHDQSHLTKHFKSLVGVTPQRYRQNSNFLQDNPLLTE
jgi:AraC-like DNA-binding protein